MAMEKQGIGEKGKRQDRRRSKKKKKEDGAGRCFHAIMEQERRVFFSLFSASSYSC